MISSENPKELGEFYGKVLQAKPQMEEGGFVGYLAGGSYLSIGPHDKVHGTSNNPERIIFFFESDDVQKDFDRIKDIPGATVIKEPYNPGDDEMMLATLADPDGNYFQLASPWNS